MRHGLSMQRRQCPAVSAAMPRQAFSMAEVATRKEVVVVAVVAGAVVRW